MAAEIEGFTIDGVVCEFVPVFEFDLDESQVLYDSTGLTIEDFLPFVLDDEEEVDKDALLDERLKNPGFVRTLMHVAYQRKNPHVPAHKVKVLIGKQSLIKALAELAAAAEDDAADPPELTLEPDTPSPRSSSLLNESSGDDSTKNSDAPAVPLTPTGTSESGTLSILPRTGSVA